MSKKTSQQETGLESIEHSLSRIEQFIEDHQKQILIALGIIVGAVLLFMGYTKLIIAPREKEVRQQMYIAERYFEKDSFELALYGDNNYPGFEDITNDYSGTKSAKLANYYAGICHYRLGNYEDAIDYLKKFHAGDEILSAVALGAIGDAYIEMQEYEEGISYYEKAANHHDNQFATPAYLFKLAQVYDYMGDFELALKNYQKIKKEYPKSQQAGFVDKNIARVEALLQGK